MAYTLHFISHTHWDREWYMSYEEHRMRLVEFMDTLLDVLSKDAKYESFHLDGQIIILEDYLEIRPYKLEEIRKFVAEGRLHIGPWYVLQDEFLTSGEANMRNLLYGIRIAKKYGDVCKVGYFPDTFGNISQMPQILNGFGIECAVVGRGVNPSENGKYSSEFLWCSPDGSTVMAAFLAGWYNNASELPENINEAKEFIENARDNAAAFCEVQHLLMMNGSDHQPVQKNLSAILADLRNELGEDNLLHSSFDNYFACMKPLKNQLKIMHGELTGQKSDGLLTLVNTASSRIYLKQLNHKAQILLEKWAEPLGSMAWFRGDDYRTDFINKAWEYLLQNHPHDSICGCSIDDVHEEMVVRFKKSIAISRSLIERELKYIVNSIDTSMGEEGDIPVVVFNPLGWLVSENVVVNVNFDENTQDEFSKIIAVDCEGNLTYCDVTNKGRTFSYELPEDSFRKVKYVKSYQVSFWAENLPPLGYKTYFLRKELKKATSKLVYSENFAENEYLRLDIGNDGTLCISDKTSGQVYQGLNIFEDACDIGDEYNFVTLEGEAAITTEGRTAEIRIWECGKESVTFAIQHRIMLAEGAQKDMKKRSEKIKELLIVSYITLAASSRRVDVATEFDNQISDHRVRALFKSGIKTETCMVDGQFDIVTREIKTGENWKNPSNCQRQQAFVDLFDGSKGLIIANRGLPEYEILKDNSNIIAITLLRAIGELGDWGYFPTPEAECLGKCRLEYSIIPYYGVEGSWPARKQAYQFHTGPLIATTTDIHTGKYKPKYSFGEISGENINVSALKKSENRDSLILRVYNPGDADGILKLTIGSEISNIYETDLNEKRKSMLKVSKGFVDEKILSKKIKTFEILSKGKEGLKE